MEYKFEHIATNSTAKKLPEESDREHYIGLEHLDTNCFTISRWGSDVTPVGEKLLMKKGDVLFGKRRAYQRKVGIAPFDGIFSAHGMVLRPKEDVIDKDFFPFFINSDQFMERAIRISVGGLSPTINWKDLKEQVFELPSLEEQKVLACKLWAAYNLKESYKTLLAKTDEMVKSRFIEECYSRYPKQKLGGHISVIRGVSYKPSDVRSSVDEGVAIILRSNNIADGEINFDDLVYVVQERVQNEQKLKPGDIVMCGSNGSIGLVGKAGLLKDNMPNTAFGAFCLGIKCKETILPEYLNTYFNTQVYRNEIESMGNGTNIINIRPDNITNLSIPIPPVEKQMAFVEVVNQADKSKFELKQAIEKIDKVMRALQQ